MNTIHIGNWQIDAIKGGDFRIDGGLMFGIVPRVVWEQVQTPDDRNRVPITTNCLLARDAEHTILIDTGYGGGWDQRQVENLDLKSDEPLLATLASTGVAPDDVDIVAFTHLHFDHAGGATRSAKSGNWVPTFPNAAYVVQEGEWADAMGDKPELRGSYHPARLAPFAQSGRLKLIRGDAEIVPGLRCLHTGGHTEWHQGFVFSSGGQTLACLGDLCPTSAHLRTMWCVAYDLYPLQTRRRKVEILGQAADEGWLVFYGHDPAMVASRIERDPRRMFRPAGAIRQPRS